MTDISEKWVCIWCGCASDKPTFRCTAEDGNGHLFEAAKRLTTFRRGDQDWRKGRTISGSEM